MGTRRLWPPAWLLTIAVAALICRAQPVITTVAGADWLFPGDGRPAVEAPLGGVLGMGVAADQRGNLFILDSDNRMVMKVGPEGLLTVVAGNGLIGFSGDGGQATSASLFLPQGVAVDASGNVYIAEYAGRIRKVTPAGIIATIAGNGEVGFSGDGGPATAAVFHHPTAVAAGSAGEIYIVDRDNHRIRKIGPDGIITTIAGNGRQGFSGDGGPATAASLDTPYGVAADRNGNVYLVDANNFLVRQVTPYGIISTVAGGGASTADGVPAAAAAIIPTSIAVDAAGDFYFTDFFTSRVRKVSGGIITTVAGNGEEGFGGDGGPALRAMLSTPSGVAVDGSGIYIADSGNIRIRKVALSGGISTVAGNGRFRASGDGGPAATAALYLPLSVVLDNNGNIYIAEPQRSRLRRVAPNGVISVYAGTGEQGFSGDNGPATSAAFFFPSGMAADRNGNLYIADQINARVRKVSPSGMVTTVAGVGRHGFSGDDGPATAAALRGPVAVAVDAAGNLYISDAGNHRIRKVTAADGRISTVAGNGQKGFSGDNGPALNAALSDPAGIRLDAQSNLYIADSSNHRIRRVTPAGVISTVAGNGQQGFAGDNGPAVAASLNKPAGLALDASNNLYIADQFNHRIRRVGTSGIIVTVAGRGLADYSGDGGPATAATLAAPSDVAVDANGNLLIADWFNHRIRAVLAGPPSFQVSPATLAYSADAGGPPSVAQRIGLTSSVPGLPFSLGLNTSTGGGWLRASTSSGVMPTTLDITVDPAGLSAGNYAGAITVLSPLANPPSQIITVALAVRPAPPPKLVVKPDSLSFAFVEGAAAAAQSLTVSNDGGGSLDFTAAAQTAAAVAWLSVTPDSGTSRPAAPVSLTVTANPSRLTPGTYSGTVLLRTSTGEQRPIGVTITVSAVPRSMLLSPAGLTFTAVVGGGAPPPQPFTILNSGAGVMNWSLTAPTLSGGPGWLSVAPSSGFTDASSAGSLAQVRVQPIGLGPGVYYGQIQVAAAGADNPSQFVCVVLNVLPAGSDPGPLLQPTGLVFTATAGGVSPGSQTVVVANLTDRPNSFTSGRLTQDGKAWFVHLPADATVAPDRLTRIVVQPDITGLAPGVYRGALTLLFRDSSTRTVSLLLVVKPGPRTTDSLPPYVAQAACTPTRLLPVFTSLGSESNVPAGWPNRMIVSVVDDCGNPMLAGSVVAEFSNSEPPQSLVSSRDGTWSGVWQVRDAATQVTIRVQAEAPERKIRGTAEITSASRSNQAAPFVGAGAIVSAASFASRTPLAPGSIISIFGSRLAERPIAATRLPLENELGGALVTIAGRPLPLLFASDGQINAIIPYDIPVNTRHQLAVRRGGSVTVPEPVTVAAAQPAVFTKDQSGKGQGVILDTNFRYLEPGNPARAGDPIVIYCSGLGAVDPPLPAGAAASASPLSRTTETVSLTIGGVPAEVFFAGLAPGFTGLYQVNAFVPAGVAPGDAVPLVLSVAGQLSPPVTLAVR